MAVKMDLAVRSKKSPKWYICTVEARERNRLKGEWIRTIPTPSMNPKDTPLKAFIPAWLNRAGLSQAEFRVFCCLASRADVETGIAWPSAETIAADCVMARRTVWKALARLEDLGLIRRSGKPFGGSSRYEILPSSRSPSAPDADTPTGAIGAPDAPPIGASNAPSTGANGAPDEAPPIGALNAPPIGASFAHQSVQTRPREGITKEGTTNEGITKKGTTIEGITRQATRGRETPAGISPDGCEFADWFRTTLPAGMNLAANWRTQWGKVFDDLVRLDRREPSEIREVAGWARRDPFWSSNFLSPVKLRDRNREGVQYFDVFTGRMKAVAPTTTANRPAAVLNLGRRAHHSGTS
jgi:hypothetical protein